MKNLKKDSINGNFQEFIFVRTYARWIDELNRREHWDETVQRYCSYMKTKLGDKITDKELKDVFNAIYNMEVMPSMRALWSAGGAADADNFAMFNCAFTTIESLKDFAEILYILMNGTGVGFSVERKYINNLPEINEKVADAKEINIIFEDSKLGWAQGFEKVLKCLWAGVPFKCDYSKIRPRGARLKTFGGRASGPEPLMALVKFVTEIVERNRGLQIQPIDAHDIACKIADIVVVGGVRRSALISLSDLTDNQMAHAKSGEFWHTHPHRKLSNNSVSYTRKPDLLSFIDEWKNLYKSKSGERGIFNRVAAQLKASENQRRIHTEVVGTNPCGEVLLRNKQLCNLTEVVVRPDDTFETLKQKVKIATMLGTWQASFTDFHFVDKKWKENCDEERLLGVSLTGVRDHKYLGCVNDTAKKWLSDLKHVAIATNKKVSTKLGINRATAITCIKPSGTVSLLVDSAPGAHTRQTKTGYYIRRVRISATDPLLRVFQEANMPVKAEVGESLDNCTTYVLEFPCRAPKDAKTKMDETAQEQLEFWKMYRAFWCEHNPSITIYVSEEEWLRTATWVYENFDEIGGLTFLPTSDHVYQLAPYEDIDEETYKQMSAAMPKIDFDKLAVYETEDMTEGSKEYACTGGSCELR